MCLPADRIIKFSSLWGTAAHPQDSTSLFFDKLRGCSSVNIYPQQALPMLLRGRGNSIIESPSVMQADQARVEPGMICLYFTEMWRSTSMLSTCLHQCWRLVQQNSPLLSCLCDNACKRSLAIWCKSRASCPVSRPLSVPVWAACAEQGRQCDSNRQTKTNVIDVFYGV